MPTSSRRDTLLLAAAPALFVLLWSTGWIAARAAAPFADPLTFLAVRFALAAGLLAIAIPFLVVTWPRRPIDVWHLVVSGILIHAIYLGGVWWAVAQGVPTALSGLIAAVQPVLTASLAPVLAAERLGFWQWIGVILGFAGILVSLSPDLVTVGAADASAMLVPLAVNGLAMVSVTLGTFYQKRFVPSTDLRTATLVQYATAAMVMGTVAYAIEPMRLEWNAQTVVTMAWSVVALSLGAIGLYLMLIRKGAVSRAAVLIYLVPPAVAIEALVIFGEALGPVEIAGIVVTAIGVALAVRR
ncbi:MAG: DMT family transporter [Hyphomicrobiaceae bacterium]